MRKAIIILSILIILISIINFTRILPLNITQPILFFALATLLLLRSIESYKDGEASSFVIGLLTSLFVYGVTIYNIFTTIYVLKVM